MFWAPSYVIPVLSKDHFCAFCLFFPPDPAHVYFSFSFYFFLFIQLLFLLFFPLCQSPPLAARTMEVDGALGPGSPPPLARSPQSFLKPIGQTPLEIVTISPLSLLHPVGLISCKPDPEGAGSWSLLGIEGCPGLGVPRGLRPHPALLPTVSLAQEWAPPFILALPCKEVPQNCSYGNLVLVKWGCEALSHAPLNLRNNPRTWRSMGYWHVLSDVARELGPCPQMIHCCVCTRVCVWME